MGAERRAEAVRAEVGTGDEPDESHAQQDRQQAVHEARWSRQVHLIGLRAPGRLERIIDSISERGVVDSVGKGFWGMQQTHDPVYLSGC
eukprot:7858086-Pyramimonas_sp.AAC.1